MANIRGYNDRDDVLNGTPDADAIWGLGGDDDLNGEGGDDWLFGGDGADAIDGGAGERLGRVPGGRRHRDRPEKCASGHRVDAPGRRRLNG